ncbi:MAG: purine-nucleoside phosphorylase [Bacteroidales bacterium]|jgi:purine-nucleoside phosphorylase|nr:purine-nucleoside phosphorylase [Bacteroidales bacterium]
MSIHIGAKKSDIAETVLLPGDPLRAKFIADTFLNDVIMYNEVRGMYGFTGYYKGKRISVQGTGMGVPSISIYVNELITEYDVQKLMRVGTCGALQNDVELKDVILGMAASTDSSVNRHRFNGMDFAPIADFELLYQAYQYALKSGRKVKVGNVLTSDTFYYDDYLADPFQKWKDFGILAVEMESTALYTLAAKYKRKALTILTVSDHIVKGEFCNAEERQTAFTDMMEIALEIA